MVSRVVGGIVRSLDELTGVSAKHGHGNREPALAPSADSARASSATSCDFSAPQLDTLQEAINAGIMGMATVVASRFDQLDKRIALLESTQLDLGITDASKEDTAPPCSRPSTARPCVASAGVQPLSKSKRRHLRERRSAVKRAADATEHVKALLGIRTPPSVDSAVPVVPSPKSSVDRLLSIESLLQHILVALAPPDARSMQTYSIDSSCFQFNAQAPEFSPTPCTFDAEEHCCPDEFRCMPAMHWEKLHAPFRVDTDNPGNESDVQYNGVPTEEPVEHSVKFAQLVAAMTNTSDRGIMRKYDFRKKPCHALQPKRPPSAYFLFAQEEKDKLGNAMPVGGWSAHAKRLTQTWADIDDERKESFKLKAEELLLDYHAMASKH